MRTYLWIGAIVLLASCVSQRRTAAPDEHELEARQYEEADVRAEVESRIREHDFRFKGWQESISATITILPGVTEADGRVIERLGVPEAEVLYVQGLDPFVVADQDAYEKMMKAKFDYMRRFNQELLDHIREYHELPKEPNPESSTNRPRQLRSALRADLRVSNDRGAAAGLGELRFLLNSKL